MENRELNKTAFKAGIWYTIGNLLLKSCIFFTLPIFTKLLSTSDFGIYNTYMAYEGIITAILGLGLYGSIKNAKLDFKDNFNNYLSSILTFSLGFLLLILLVGNIFYNFYAKTFGFSRIITNCLILQSYGSFLIYLYGSKLNIEFKYKSYIVLSCFNTILNIILSILLIKYVFPNQGYLGRILGSAIPLIIVSIVIVIIIFCNGKKFISKKYWSYGLKIGLPLIPHVISQSLLSQFDRIMISNMESSSSAGIYSYIYTICTITYVICCSLDNAWTSWVYMKIKDNNKEEIRKASIKYIGLFSLLTIGFICVMPEITKIMADKTYWDGMDLIIPLSLSNYYIFMYMIPVGIEYYNKKTNFISIGTVGAAVVNLLLNYFAIKNFGFKAAAYTTLISYFLLYYFHRIIANKYNITNYYDFKKIRLINILTIILSFILLLTLKFSLISIIIRYILVSLILIILYMEKDSIIGIFREEEKNEKNNKKSS